MRAKRKSKMNKTLPALGMFASGVFGVLILIVLLVVAFV
jgi:hypothetical protein